MYIVVPTPVYPTGAANFTTTFCTTAPTVEYYHTKEQLMERLKKGGSVRVFEATELDFKLDVQLTPKPALGLMSTPGTLHR